MGLLAPDIELTAALLTSPSIQPAPRSERGADVRVVLVGDDQIIAEGLRAMLARDSDRVELVGHVPATEDVLSAARGCAPTSCSSSSIYRAPAASSWRPSCWPRSPRSEWLSSTAMLTSVASTKASAPERAPALEPMRVDRLTTALGHSRQRSYRSPRERERATLSPRGNGRQRVGSTRNF